MNGCVHSGKRRRVAAGQFVERGSSMLFAHFGKLIPRPCPRPCPGLCAVQLGITTYLLYTNLGWAGPASLLVVLLFLPVQFVFGKLSAAAQKRNMARARSVPPDAAEPTPQTAMKVLHHWTGWGEGCLSVSFSQGFSTFSGRGMAATKEGFLLTGTGVLIRAGVKKHCSLVWSGGEERAEEKD